MNEGPSQTPIPIPTSAELYEFFNTFLGQWLKLPSQRVQIAADDIQMLPNEQGLMFYQPALGIVVIRTSEDFSKGLARLAKEWQVDHDLFTEMLVVFWHRFVSKFWKLDSRTLQPSLFKRSLPLHWPDRKPDSHLLVFVLQQPVELRLWVNLTGAEQERWKKPAK